MLHEVLLTLAVPLRVVQQANEQEERGEEGDALHANVHVRVRERGEQAAASSTMTTTTSCIVPRYVLLPRDATTAATTAASTASSPRVLVAFVVRSTLTFLTPAERTCIDRLLQLAYWSHQLRTFVDTHGAHHGLVVDAPQPPAASASATASAPPAHTSLYLAAIVRGLHELLHSFHDALVRIEQDVLQRAASTLAGGLDTADNATDRDRDHEHYPRSQPYSWLRVQHTLEPFFTLLPAACQLVATIVYAHAAAAANSATHSALAIAASPPLDVIHELLRRAHLDSPRTIRLHGTQYLSLVHACSTHGHPLVAAFFRRLHVHLHRVWYAQLHSWCCYGHLQDPYNEFFVAPAASSPAASSLAASSPAASSSTSLLTTPRAIQPSAPFTFDWQRTYELRTTMLATYMPRAIAEQALFIGKALIVLVHLGVNVSGVPTHAPHNSASIATSLTSLAMHDDVCFAPPLVQLGTALHALQQSVAPFSVDAVQAALDPAHRYLTSCLHNVLVPPLVPVAVANTAAALATPATFAGTAATRESLLDHFAFLRSFALVTHSAFYNDFFQHTQHVFASTALFRPDVELQHAYQAVRQRVKGTFLRVRSTTSDDALEEQEQQRMDRFAFRVEPSGLAFSGFSASSLVDAAVPPADDDRGAVPSSSSAAAQLLLAGDAHRVDQFVHMVNGSGGGGGGSGGAAVSSASGRGSIWHTSRKIVDRGFQCSFTFHTAPPPSSSSSSSSPLSSSSHRALAFVIQNDSLAAVAVAPVHTDRTTTSLAVHGNLQNALVLEFAEFHGAPPPSTHASTSRSSATTLSSSSSSAYHGTDRYERIALYHMPFRSLHASASGGGGGGATLLHAATGSWGIFSGRTCHVRVVLDVDTSAPSNTATASATHASSLLTSDTLHVFLNDAPHAAPATSYVFPSSSRVRQLLQLDGGRAWVGLSACAPLQVPPPHSSSSSSSSSSSPTSLHPRAPIVLHSWEFREVFQPTTSRAAPTTTSHRSTSKQRSSSPAPAHHRDAWMVWRNLCFDYTPTFPFTLILRPDVLQRYGQLFRFLVHLKRARSSLHAVWLTLKQYRASGTIRTADQRRQRIVVHQLATFRSKLQFVLDALLGYIDVDVIDVHFAALVKQVEQSHDFERLRVAHEEYLAAITAHVMLRDRVVHDSLLDVVGHCFALVRSVDTPDALSQLDVNVIHAAQEEFERRAAFLVSYLTRKAAFHPMISRAPGVAVGAAATSTAGGGAANVASGGAPASTTATAFSSLCAQLVLRLDYNRYFSHSQTGTGSSLPSPSSSSSSSSSSSFLVSSSSASIASF